MLEGETILTLAGLAAHRGYLALPTLIVVGAIGGFLGDQIYFAIGRRFGARFIGRFPRLARRAGRATALVERHPEFSVIAVRFVYGLRVVGPIAMGMSRIGGLRFAALNALGAALWSACWIGAGYVAGTAVEAALGDLKHVEHALFAAALGVAVIATVALSMAPPQRTVRQPAFLVGLARTTEFVARSDGPPLAALAVMRDPNWCAGTCNAPLWDPRATREIVAASRLLALRLHKLFRNNRLISHCGTWHGLCDAAHWVRARPFVCARCCDRQSIVTGK